jgi:hypothetical protein
MSKWYSHTTNDTKYGMSKWYSHTKNDTKYGMRNGFKIAQIRILAFKSEDGVRTCHAFAQRCRRLGEFLVHGNSISW